MPFSDRFVSRKVNSIFTSLDLPLHIQSIRTVLPNKVRVEGVTITGKEGDTIICAMDLDTHISLPALLKNKVKLNQVYLAGVLVHLSNDTINSGLNIARAFSKENSSGAEEPEGEKASWEIIINGGEMHNISFKMTDPVSGIQIFQDIDDFKLTGFKLSLLERSLDFKTVDLHAAHGGVEISPRLIPSNDEEGSSWNFGFKKVQLSDLDFTFNQQVDSLLLNLVLKEGLIRANVTDLVNKKIDVDRISLTGADATILTGQPAEGTKSASKSASQSFPWDFIIDETNLQKVKVSMGRYTYPETPDTASPSLITVHDMHLIDTRLNKNIAGVVVKKLHFDLDNGFSLKQMKGEFASNAKSTRLDFTIETENSRAKLEGAAEGSIFGMLENPDDIRNAQISFQNTQLSLKDIFFFKGDLKDVSMLSALFADPLAIAGDVGLDRLMITFSDINVSQGNHFSIKLDGNAEHPLDPLKAKGDLSFEISALDSLWLGELMEKYDTVIDYSALTSLSLKGTISDSLGYSGIKLEVKSNLGALDFSGNIDLKNEDFDLHTTFNNLMPGQLLNVESLGAFSGSGTISGSGFSQDSLSAKVSLSLDSLNFNDYQYINTSIAAKLHYGFYEFNLLVDDPSLKTGLYTAVNRSDSTLMLNAKGTLFAQLDKLHLTKDTLSVKTAFTAGFRKTPHALESEISLQNIELLSPLEQAKIQELSAVFTTDSSQSHLKAESDFFKTDIDIGEPLKEFGSLMENYRSYLSTFVDSSDSIADTRISRLPTTNITGSISYHEALGMVLQDTGIHFDNLDFSLNNSSSDQSLNYAVSGNDLKYKGIEIGELKASALDSAGIVNVHLLANKNTFFENPAYNILINGHYDNWQSSAELSAVDDTGRFIYNVTLASDLDSNLFVLSIPKQQILLNSQQWKVENPTLLYVNLEDKKVYPSLKMQTGSSEIQFFYNEVDGVLQYSCRFDNVFLESLFRTAATRASQRRHVRSA